MKGTKQFHDVEYSLQPGSRLPFHQHEIIPKMKDRSFDNCLRLWKMSNYIGSSVMSSLCLCKKKKFIVKDLDFLHGLKKSNKRLPKMKTCGARSPVSYGEVYKYSESEAARYPHTNFSLARSKAPIPHDMLCRNSWKSRNHCWFFSVSKQCETQRAMSRWEFSPLTLTKMNERFWYDCHLRENLYLIQVMSETAKWIGRINFGSTELPSERFRIPRGEQSPKIIPKAIYCRKSAWVGLKLYSSWVKCCFDDHLDKDCSHILQNVLSQVKCTRVPRK